MADLIIPATLRIWLVFLFVFVLLRYPVPFSIVFGGIGGLAGGVASAWWQVKGGVPVAPEERRSAEKTESTRRNKRRKTAATSNRVKNTRAEKTSRWELPFLKPSPAKQRYTDRIRRTRSKRAR